MSGGNGFASARMPAYPVGGAADMAAFDALPRPVRDRLRDAPVNVAAIPLRDFWLTASGDCLARVAAIQAALDDALGAAA